ncbi:MAG: hypothetical protein RSD28_03565 [Lachnospiraceae bacterium]
MEKLIHKLRNMLYHSCNILDLAMALMVLLAILVASFSLGHSFLIFWNNRYAEASFLVFVGHVFTILIGIEFLKMLCQPSEDTVLEVLIFLVARHMIIEQTTVMENFITIVSIALLFAIKKYISLSVKKDSSTIFSNNSKLHTLFSSSSENQSDALEEEDTSISTDK